jgi:steroid 5-alpha reductase family enzyme
MTFLEIFLLGLVVVVIFMTILWIASVFLKNASIVDPFWGMGFVLLAFYYYFQTGGWEMRKIILLVLVCVWGLRLSIYLAWRNWGKGEDFRYQQFRQKYGPHRYWWFSFFQVFLLQGVLMWLISAPLLGAQYYKSHAALNILDIIGVLVWLIGIIFEAGGDSQLARFKANPQNKGKVLDTGLWKYTRHPNYFGDSCVWWGYSVICLAGGSYIPVFGSILMTALIIRVSGVFLLERSLTETKPEYKDYINRTSTFFPWPPKQERPL